MKNKNLYASLIKLGLEDYLKKRGGGVVRHEPHMDKIDSFIQKLSKEQKGVLEEKIKKKNKETHAQHNDAFHEISIACAFYNNITFLPEEAGKTPDFSSNNILVEVKTINNSDEERKRQDSLNGGLHREISPLLGDVEVDNIKEKFVDKISKKFTERICKAKEQLSSSGGHVWVVYTVDSPPKFHKKINIEIENKFDEIIKEQQADQIGSKICIRYIYFDKLREKIANSQIESAHPPLTPH